MPATQPPRFRTAFAVALGKALRVGVRLVRRGGGSALPGLVAGRVAPTLLTRSLQSFDQGLVVVTGSSGKSTTTKMLCAALSAHGLTPFTNESTANIHQGLLSALLPQMTLGGRPRARLAVLELDEAHGASLAEALAPSVVVLTNVMTDQIDRFVDPRDVAHMLERVAGSATDTVVLNADDAAVAAISRSLARPEVLWFGMANGLADELPHGLGYWSSTQTRTALGTTVTAIDGRTAHVRHRGEQVSIRLPARGAHYAVDAAAALSAASAVLGDRFNLSLAAAAISDVDPVFGRGEIVTVQGKPVELVLVQNPTSFQLNVDSLPEHLEQVLVAIGSDVRDPSYLWPVDTSTIDRVSLVSGSLAEEMALQLAYRGVEVDAVEPELGRALDAFLAAPDPASGVKTVIFSADAMRKTRRYWKLAS